MPLFYFDVHDGAGWLSDAEGSTLDDLQAAEHEAIDTLVQMAREIFPGHGVPGLEITVRDEDGKALLLATLKLSISRL